MSHPSPSFESVALGDELPEQVIPLSASLIVGGALASRDFTPVHHDPAAARATGVQDVFMNILTTNGLVGRYVTDWAGIDARVKELAVRLGAPNLPGDRMTLTGKVVARDEAAHTVEVEIAGRNAWGQHVTGRVKVALPDGAR